MNVLIKWKKIIGQECHEAVHGAHIKDAWKSNTEVSETQHYHITKDGLKRIVAQFADWLSEINSKYSYNTVTGQVKNQLLSICLTYYIL